MKQRTKKLLINLAQIVALILIALLLWYIVALATDSDLIVPDPWSVLKLTFSLLGVGQTYLALLSTLLRGVIAFAVSVVFATLLCMLVVVWRKCTFCVNAVVTFLRALPTIAIILITLILFKSTSVPVIVAFLVVFPVIYSGLRRELEHNDKLLDVCAVYDVTPAKKIKFVLLPIVRDELLTNVADQLPLCIKVVVAGEVLALPLSGIGKQMYVGKVNLDTAKVVALTLLTLIVCFVISGIATAFSKRNWNRKSLS